jgi:hypothetical protein
MVIVIVSMIVGVAMIGCATDGSTVSVIVVVHGNILRASHAARSPAIEACYWAV